MIFINAVNVAAPESIGPTPESSGRVTIISYFENTITITYYYTLGLIGQHILSPISARCEHLA